MLRFLAIMIVAGAANVYIFIPVVIVIALLLALRWYFLRTSREIKRLEAIGVFSVVLCSEMSSTANQPPLSPLPLSLSLPSPQSPLLPHLCHSARAHHHQGVREGAGQHCLLPCLPG